MSELKPIVEQSMIQYSGAVLQNRALIDVRDGLKPSARQIFYSMLLNKLTSKNAFKKTANAVGRAMADFYIHGDSSCEGVIMRAGQPFAMRYPLIEVQGNGGSLIESGNWAAPRYTESRLSVISSVLFEDINKDTISEWRDSYDNEKQYPAVLPSKGFYNLVNGTSGIGIGLASSVPQYNIRELNNALIYLIDHPDCSFDDIYCAPDFATGAILYNEAEVKESMKNGTGAACKLRSVVEYDNKERCFIVTEIPYSVYTNTICGQLETIVNEEDNPGIERFNDLTGKSPLIKIYLTKQANPEKVLRYLYKNTSLQYHFGINFTMLENGRYPRLFTWKEMLQAHIDHEKIVYRRGFEFDLKKIEDRIHVIDGLLICLANIDEVVKVIKASTSTAVASEALQKNFLLDEVQAKAVLDMKLARLAHLEVKKLEDEKTELIVEANRIHAILDSEELFNQELKKGWKEVADKFGDERRTKIINLSSDANEEPIEVKQLQLSLTNKNNLFVHESSSLYTQKRGGVGSKLKLDSGEYILDTATIKSTDTILLFAQNGNFYSVVASTIDLEKKIAVEMITGCAGDTIIALTPLGKNNEKPYIVFITKKGIIKKSLLSEYNVKRSNGVKALTLDTDDEIVNVLFTDKDRIGILTSQGNFVIVESTPIRAIGRIAKGVKGIKLNDGDYVVSGRPVRQNAKFIISVSKLGMIKQSAISEFSVQGTNTKGSKIQKLNDGDSIVDFLPINDHPDVLIASNTSAIKIATTDIPLQSRGTLGVKGIKLSANGKVIALS